MSNPYDQPQPSLLQQPASPEPQPTLPANSPPLQGPTSTYAEATQINVADLLHLVPQLVTKIDHLEKELKEHKQTYSCSYSKIESEDAANSSKHGRNLREKDVFETPKGKGFSFKSASEEIKSGFTNISSGEVRVSQRKGKEVLEEQPQLKRSKRQIREEEANLAEIVRVQAQEAAEIERKAELQRLDALAAKRLNDEFERARMEASTELRKSVFGCDIDAEDYDKKMVELVEKRRRGIREQKLKAKKNKPIMTQANKETTLMNMHNFDEVKEEFDKLVKQVESFTPINFEATKDNLKRVGEELQTETSKRLKSDEAKVDESTKKTRKRRKQIARKGLHTDMDKDDSEDSDEASEKDDSTSGTKIPINPVPVAMKSPSIANYKIIKQGRKGVYQIVRENGTDKVYISFGAMLTDISRDDLTELYMIVMRKHGMDKPEDELEKVLWEYLKNIVHCLNLELVDIYMLIERKYPLSAEVYKAMLNKKHQGGKPDEDCYKLLKMMEKQAGIRN
ncbi:hypothetical protein Tco_1182341 [Tanacetum coccineum]